MVRLQEKYKLSQYNVSFDDDGVLYLWNTYSGALLKLDNSSQGYLKKFPMIDDNSNEFKLLKSSGFIVYECIDEFGRICLLEKENMFTRDANSMSVVIAPGMGCNYKCHYCFQPNTVRSEVMTPEIATDVAEYICQQLKQNPNIKDFVIKWFGGEPLLYIDIIDIISRRVIDYTKQNNIKYSASIITNGRLFDANVLTKMQELLVDWAQITVDGMRELYSKSKKASYEDYDCVIDNICRIAEKIRLSIRINIPDNDVNKAIETTEYLLSQRGLLGKVHIYFAFVRNYSVSLEAEQKAYIEYANNYSKWIDYMVEHYDIYEIKKSIPERRVTYCGLVKMCNIGIDPRGELHKCGHCFGDGSTAIGDIWHGRFFNNAEMAYYSTVDKHIEKGCPKCEYLPICMGQCAYHRVIKYEGFNCDIYKKLQLKLKLLEGGVKV